MICQIACRCGLPPSVIADTWSPEELRQAEALAQLEGWGQEKRRTAAILAELHNVSRIEQWIRSIQPKQPAPPMPTMLTESTFLPKRPKPKPRKKATAVKLEAKQEAAAKNLSSIMNGLCGY